MAKGESKKPTAPYVTVPVPRYGLSTEAFTSSTSGTTTIFQNITMPDGRQMRLLNKDVFYRALEKSKKKK